MSSENGTKCDNNVRFFTRFVVLGRSVWHGPFAYDPHTHTHEMHPNLLFFMQKQSFAENAMNCFRFSAEVCF